MNIDDISELGFFIFICVHVIILFLIIRKDERFIIADTQKYSELSPKYCRSPWALS